MGLPLHLGPARYGFLPPSLRPCIERVEGEAQPSTKRRRGDWRSETRSTARLLPQPLAPASLCACAALPTATSPPQHTLRARARGRGGAHGGGSPRRQLLGDLRLRQEWGRSKKGSRGPNLCAPPLGSRGTTPAFHRGIVDPGTDNPPAHAEPTAFPKAAPSGFPAMPMAPARGRGEA